MDLSCEILSTLLKSSDDTRENNNNNKNQRYYSDVTENSRQYIFCRDKVRESFKEITGGSRGSKMQPRMVNCSNLSMRSI